MEQASLKFGGGHLFGYLEQLSKKVPGFSSGFLEQTLS